LNIISLNNITTIPITKLRQSLSEIHNIGQMGVKAT